MRKLFITACIAAASLATGGCAGGYGGVYGDGAYGYGGPYAYDGYYDGYYGPIYDGYWGSNGYFYYRGNAGARRFYRADRSHFARNPGGGSFRPYHGQFAPGPGMRMPHFGGGRGGGGHHR